MGLTESSEQDQTFNTNINSATTRIHPKSISRDLFTAIPLSFMCVVGMHTVGPDIDNKTILALVRNFTERLTIFYDALEMPNVEVAL